MSAVRSILERRQLCWVPDAALATWQVFGQFPVVVGRSVFFQILSDRPPCTPQFLILICFWKLEHNSLVAI